MRATVAQSTFKCSSPRGEKMFAEQNELEIEAPHFQLELPFMEVIFDQACETLFNRVIRICNHYFPSMCEQGA
jgi:hypothetical protein